MDFIVNELLAPVLAAALTAVYLNASGALGEVRKNTRLARNLQEDLRRWIRDRDRVRTVELRRIVSEASARGQT